VSLTRVIALMAFFTAISGFVATSGAMADVWKPLPAGCDDPVAERRIAPCSALIAAPDTDPALRAEAFFRRGVAYWQLSQPERAIKDYSESIRIEPDFGAALNNRADAWLRLGKPSQGVEDIERALQVDPQNPTFNATRGQIGQSVGDPEGAMRDHDNAMAFGGTTFVKLYQCGLRMARLYRGPVDGILRPEVLGALRVCVDQGSHCDPLPESATTECHEPVA
jgi:tetratricopeptide (TPR) repeat protein